MNTMGIPWGYYRKTIAYYKNTIGLVCEYFLRWPTRALIIRRLKQHVRNGMRPLANGLQPLTCADSRDQYLCL